MRSRRGVSRRSRKCGHAVTPVRPKTLARLVVPVPIAPVVEADPDDDAVLACAVAAQAEVIVSGDSDLLALESYEGIPIITAVQLMARIAS